MTTTHPDMALAERAGSGDDAAWREIYTATRERLFALLAYHIGNRDEALDVLQETYVSAVRGIHGYRGEGSLESWLCGIALRRARDWKRRFLGKFKRTDAIEDRDDLDQVLPQPDPTLGLRLRKALAALPERQRSSVVLHEHLGYSFREVGEILGIGESTARVHCFRGREALRTRLGDAPIAATDLAMQGAEIMKKLFEQHRAQMTPDEDRRLWSNLRDEITGQRPKRRGWRLPALASTAAVAVLAITLIRTGTVEQGLEQEFARELAQPAPAIQSTEPLPVEIVPSVGGTLDQDGTAGAGGERADLSQDKKDDLHQPGALDDANRQAEVRAPKQAVEGKESETTGAATAVAGEDLRKNEESAKGDALAERLQAARDESQASASATSEVDAIQNPAGTGRVNQTADAFPVESYAQTTGNKPQLRESLASRVPPASEPVEEQRYRQFGDIAGPRRTNDVGGTDPVNGQAYGAMFFRDYGTNPFLDPRDDRFATFAVDVDQASYAMARAYLQRGQLPPPEAVRVEEFVNAFDHGYPAPYGELTVSRETIPSEHGTFAIYLDAAPSPFGKDMHLMRVGLKGREIDAAVRKPAVLTFVIDTSGSMSQGNRLELVKQSLRLMLDGLRPEDRVAVVAYGNQASVLLRPTSAADRGAIDQVLAQLQPNGGTNAEAGLRTGYDLAGRFFAEGCINRVILCSDGVANIGVTGADGIGAMLKNQSERGIELTAIGVGLGNYNDVLLEQLADSGDGNYFYVDTLDEARDVFVNNLTGTLQTIARDVKIQVEFKPGTVRKYRLLGYENRDIADRDFRNDTVDAGEVGAGHEVTALFEVHFEDDAKDKDRFATVRVRYADPATGRVTEEARGMVMDEVQDGLKTTHPSFRLDAAVAEFAEILRESYWAREGSLSHALGLARSASWDMGQPAQARELVQLLETAMQLKTWPPAGYDPERDDR